MGARDAAEVVGPVRLNLRGSVPDSDPVYSVQLVHGAPPLETTTDLDSVSVWDAVSMTVRTAVNVPLAVYEWLTTAPEPLCPSPKLQL